LGIVALLLDTGIVSLTASPDKKKLIQQAGQHRDYGTLCPQKRRNKAPKRTATANPIKVVQSLHLDGLASW
jgi:hypothetical protein